MFQVRTMLWGKCVSGSEIARILLLPCSDAPPRVLEFHQSCNTKLPKLFVLSLSLPLRPRVCHLTLLLAQRTGFGVARRCFLAVIEAPRLKTPLRNLKIESTRKDNRQQHGDFRAGVNS